MARASPSRFDPLFRRSHRCLGRAEPDRPFDSREAQLSQITEGLSPESTFMQGKLAQISREMEGLPDEQSVAQLDAAIKKHLKV
jgi:hypothetical protein